MNQINFKINNNNQKINLNELAGQIFNLSKTDSDVVMTLPAGLLFSDIQKEKIQAVVDSHKPSAPSTCSLTITEYLESLPDVRLVAILESQQAQTALNFIFPLGKGTFTSPRAVKLVNVLSTVLACDSAQEAELKQIFIDREVLT